MLRHFSQGTWTPDTHSRSAVGASLILAAAGLVVGVYLLVFR
jgi:NADH:ubiquinone oxidoreductase subunit 4 (subunit M)